jgi:hypothetical protein
MDVGWWGSGYVFGASLLGGGMVLAGAVGWVIDWASFYLQGLSESMVMPRAYFFYVQLTYWMICCQGAGDSAVEILRQIADDSRKFDDLFVVVTKCFLEVAALSNALLWGLWWDVRELTLGLNMGAGYEGGEEGEYWGRRSWKRWGGKRHRVSRAMGNDCKYEETGKGSMTELVGFEHRDYD